MFFCIGSSFSMVKTETKKTFNFGKKRRRLQQPLAAGATLLAHSSQAESLPPSLAPDSSSLPDAPLLSEFPCYTFSVIIARWQYVLCIEEKTVLQLRNLFTIMKKIVFLVHLEMLKPLFSGLLYPKLKCCKPSLELEVNNQKNCGLAISLTVKCIHGLHLGMTVVLLWLRRNVLVYLMSIEEQPLLHLQLELAMLV